MSEYITSNGVFNDFVDKYVERVSHVIDEKTLEKLERELAEYGYVKVVRCRDCRFAVAKGYGCGRGNDGYLDVEPDGFCAWGEREASGKKSIYEKLFGTPERAARTLVGIACDGTGCEDCSLYSAHCTYDEAEQLEWLKG